MLVTGTDGSSEILSQANSENLDAKIEQLLNVEKQMRLAGDVSGTRKAATDILQLCFEARAWKTLNDQIVVLSKRRGQLKQVLAANDGLFFFCFLFGRTS